ncbi:MAG: HlyC/CorC family transporter [Ignavibacteriales bacterium]|nr:HlyC/CorC family transporter [Ignavibacteriales bacterium]
MDRSDKFVRTGLSAGKRFLKSLLMKGGLLKADLSEAEIREVIDAGTESGALDKTEHELIKSILEFSDITVKEIMIPRPDIVAVDMNMPTDKLIHKVIDEGYSRIPVYKKTMDNMMGVIYSKDLLSLLEHRDLIILQDIIRPVYFVPESKKISQLLRELQQRKVHLGIVVDEFGGTEGLVTMEDIIEEIVGEILDEYDEVGKAVEKSTDGLTVVDAAMSIGDFNAQFKTNIPEGSDYETLAGFLQKMSGKLPEVNEEIKFGECTFTILSKSARRIRQVKISPGAKLKPEEALKP